MSARMMRGCLSSPTCEETPIVTIMRAHTHDASAHALLYFFTCPLGLASLRGMLVVVTIADEHAPYHATRHACTYAWRRWEAVDDVMLAARWPHLSTAPFTFTFHLSPARQLHITCLSISILIHT